MRWRHTYRCKSRIGLGAHEGVTSNLLGRMGDYEGACVRIVGGVYHWPRRSPGPAQIIASRDQHH